MLLLMIKRKWDEANGSDGNIRNVFEKYQLDKSSKFHESKDIYGVVVRYLFNFSAPSASLRPPGTLSASRSSYTTQR